MSHLERHAEETPLVLALRLNVALARSYAVTARTYAEVKVEHADSLLELAEVKLERELARQQRSI
jgi:hypothetical protein